MTAEPMMFRRAVVVLAIVLLAANLQAQQLSREEIARGLYNRALLADEKESDELLAQVISNFPTTVTATEAIRLVAQRQASRRIAEHELAERLEKIKNLRSELLGGYQVSDIVVHGRLVPVPNGSIIKRQGENPSIIKLEGPFGVAGDLLQFFLTTVPEYKWEPFGSRSFARCARKPSVEKPGSVEQLCIDVDRFEAKASLYMTTMKEEK
jgi:hypothetical protein